MGIDWSERNMYITKRHRPFRYWAKLWTSMRSTAHCSSRVTIWGIFGSKNGYHALIHFFAAPQCLKSRSFPIKCFVIYRCMMLLTWKKSNWSVGNTKTCIFSCHVIEVVGGSPIVINNLLNGTFLSHSSLCVSPAFSMGQISINYIHFIRVLGRLCVRIHIFHLFVFNPQAKKGWVKLENAFLYIIIYYIISMDWLKRNNIPTKS